MKSLPNSRVSMAPKPITNASAVACPITSVAASFSLAPSDCATSGAVTAERKLKMRKVKLKTAVATPRPPSSVLPRCPTKAVSTTDSSGSIASAPRAGTARSKILRSSGVKDGVYQLLDSPRSCAYVGSACIALSESTLASPVPFVAGSSEFLAAFSVRSLSPRSRTASSFFNERKVGGRRIVDLVLGCLVAKNVSPPLATDTFLANIRRGYGILAEGEARA
mmetsp:Transcript_7238/g.26621  ORF Transcript_7238/g.26621 Transcript_7238/m.26621 type:complete len:222 (+) Transcript_7238:1145-1810(+)